MGYGTYREDYGGLGRSINVRSPSTTDERYEAYVADCRDNGHEPSDRAEYDKDEYDSANEGILSIVESVAEDVGLTSVLEGRFGRRRADFDKDITAVAMGGVVDVGWRSWVSDFVVAIGPNFEFGNEAVPADAGGKARAFDPEWVTAFKGREPDDFATDYKTMLDGFERLLRLSLMQGGHETATPTSSYTSSTDERPDDIDAQVGALEEKVREQVLALSRDFGAALAATPAEGRVEVAKAIEAMGREFRNDAVLLVVPTYEAALGQVVLWTPGEVGSGQGPVAAMVKPPTDMVAYLTALPEVDGMVPVPLGDGTATLYATLQNAMDGEAFVVLSAEQFCEATSQDCVIVRKFDGVEREVTLHEAGPAPGPRP